MIFEIIKDSVKLIVIGALLFYLLGRYVRWRRPQYTAVIDQHRLSILLILSAVLIGIKVSEDALTGDSGPFDRGILLFLHKNVPEGLIDFFEVVTLSGSFSAIVAIAVVGGGLMMSLRNWFEVILLASSTVGGGLVIYLLKLVTARERPALWETRWYWGTSFPSGHTLETTCVATALVLCLSRVWPKNGTIFRVAALLWVVLVGGSRLVLGVHWPTDVMAAACVGMLIPVSLQVLFVRLKWLQKP